MKQRTIRMIIVMLSISLFTSCSGQTPLAKVSQSALHDVHPFIGDTVQELGKHLMVIFQDRKNNYWFGSWGEGLYRYDGKNILHYTTEDGLAHNRIDEIRQDKSGFLYFNTPAGISKFDGFRFTTLTLTKNSSALWKLHPDDLWFKGYQDSGVVYRYDGLLLHRLAFPKIALGEDLIARYPRDLYPAMQFSPYDVYTIYRDTKGHVWFGSGVLGVCRYDGKSHHWIAENDVTELDGGPANGVRSILETDDGYFWFSNALYRYKVYDDQITGMHYQREAGIAVQDGNAAGIMLDGYLSAVVDDQGYLWIVTYRAGVYRFNPSTYFNSTQQQSSGKDDQPITRFIVTDNGNPITLFSIYKDNAGDLWLGTHENGVYRFNGETFERFKP